MTRPLLLLLLAGALGAACGGGAEPPPEEAEVSATVERTVPMAGRRFVLDGFDGEVTVAGRTDSTATLRFVKKGRAGTEVAAQALLDGITITTDSTAEAYTVRLAGGGEGASVDVRVQVPYRTPIQVELDNGPVTIEAISAPLAVTLGNGPVDIRGAAGDLAVDVTNGDVTATMAGFRAQTQVEFAVVNGALTLTVPPTTSAQVEATAQVGTVEIRGLTLKDRIDDRATTGTTVRGLLGSGDGRILLRTQNGAVVLRRAQ